MKIYVLNTFILSKTRFKWLKFKLTSHSKNRDLKKFSSKLRITIKTAMEIPSNTPSEIVAKLLEPWDFRTIIEKANGKFRQSIVNLYASKQQTLEMSRELQS